MGFYAIAVGYGGELRDDIKSNSQILRMPTEIEEEEVKEGEKTWLKLACYGHSKPWLFVMMIAGLFYDGTRSKGPGSGGTFSGLV